MKNLINTKKNVNEDFARKFKMGYAYRMGGTQTVILPNGQEFKFDDREYYSGRGSKYNSSVKHDSLGSVVVSKKDFMAELKHEREMRKNVKERAKQLLEKQARYLEFKERGIYEIEGEFTKFIVLSSDESYSKTFDSQRLAKTLGISTHDASLLHSEGKTYVFAKQLTTGKVIELYHSSLDCNSLSILISYPSDEEIATFNHDEWASAPFAHMVGMTENKNHFVC